MEIIQIMYHDEPNGEPLARLSPIRQGDWIDLYTAEPVVMTPNEFRLISLGVSMKLPDGYEAHIVPRSSTFLKYGILQTNHMGVIDNSYSGENDIWRFPALATRLVHIPMNTRICQFRIVPKMGDVVFSEVDHLNGPDRGGFGSTGES